MRLLTLTGTGGVGKTRLALAAAAGVASTYTGGVWLVELAALAVPGLVEQAIATALGVREASGRPLLDVVIDTLGDQPVLLLVDNCEHLLDACAAACEALLLACPRLTILTTSREPLGLAGETVWRVPSLAVPDPNTLAGSAEAFEAVQLFADRARTVHPAFALSPMNSPTVADICRQLDGIPLAIELAAAWTPTLSVHDIAVRLGDRLRLLTGGARTALPRQQTLRGTLDWSYELLSDWQQVLLRRLSTFEGGWTLDAAEAVCGYAPIPSNEVVNLLAALVDKSLVLAEPDADSIRYRMLETTRQYGLELLERHGESGTVQQSHARYFVTVAEIAARELLGPRQRRWIDRLDRERDNMRGALRWGAEFRPDVELAMVAALWDYWWMRGHLSEGQLALQSALAHTPDEPSTARARAIHGAALLAAVVGDIPGATSRFQTAAAMFERVEDTPGLVRALCDLSSSMIFLGDEAAAEEIGTRALSLARTIPEDWALGYALHMIGQLRLSQGRFRDVVQFADEALPVWCRLGDTRGLAHEQLSAAIAMRNLGEGVEAARIARQALAHFTELGERWGQFGALLSLAASAATLADGEAAATLVGAAESFSRTMGAAPIPVWERELTYARTHVAQLLGQRQLQTALADGRAMSLRDAIDFTRALVFVERTPTPSERPDGLTPREVEVLRLLAQRYSNGEIAEALVLSVRTVERHISNIYAKSGISSRREAVDYVKRRRHLISEQLD